MSRQNIMQLSRLQNEYALTGPNGSFIESAEDALNEDIIRAKMLRIYAAQNSATEAKDLAKRMGSTVPPCSLASARYMHDVRQIVVPHLWQLVAQHDPEVRAFTLCSRKWEFPAADLKLVDPLALVSGLRADFYRRGARDLNGFLFANQDAEFNSATLKWRFHWHGIGSGALLEAIEGLRGSPKYSRPKDIRISRSPLTHLPSPITYLIKPFWGSRWQGPIDGHMRRQKWRSRVPEPWHSQLLMWLDRWRPADLALLLGMSVKSGGLVMSSKNKEWES